MGDAAEAVRGQSLWSFVSCDLKGGEPRAGVLEKPIGIAAPILSAI